MDTQNGRCFCGNISFEFNSSRDVTELPFRTCSCLFCQKQGGVYTSDPTGTLKVNIQDDSKIIKYQFATKTAEFLICSECGIMQIVISRIEEKVYGIINVKSFDHTIDISNPSMVDFSKETREERLNRRKKTWIGTVVLNSNKKM